ncbi:integrase arm-type DNA-binding domain-containing protein [Sphingomonas sp. dw_22]|uniref:tyrosine-type recombinase/integrase n=1 Tax=Sphingomonas sp. dw_22 TaxID=2721175 RepID=UPI001BD2DCDC|nr:integrase arm-type DNA-binding domain-containing protein [Sphingomonas sp. dw_22]
MRKLTKTTVDAIAVPKNGQVFLWDSEVRNFGVRVSQGGAKAFVVQYRNAEGRSRRMTIGRVGILTVDEARKLARMHLGRVAWGEDPAADKRGRREAPSVADVCDWYLEEAESGRLLGRRNRPIKDSTLYMDRSRIERHIKPLLGSRKVASLNTADISRMQADIAAGKTAVSRRSGRGRFSAGGAGAAARTVSTLQAIFAHAKRLNVIEDNPAVGVRRLAGNRRERRLSAQELAQFGEAMRELVEFGEARKGLDLVRLIAVTGFRLNEAQGIRRPWVDQQNAVITLPDTKSDGQRRPVGREAIRIIAAQPGYPDSDYVFPAELSRNFYRQGPDVILRIVKRARLENVTAHTLRHTFGSVAGDLGFSELTIAAMLGHGKRGVTQGYIHIDEALRLAIECTSRKIAELLDGVSTTVAPFATLKEAFEYLEVEPG